MAEIVAILSSLDTETRATIILVLVLLASLPAHIIRVLKK